MYVFGWKIGKNEFNGHLIRNVSSILTNCAECWYSNRFVPLSSNAALWHTIMKIIGNSRFDNPTATIESYGVWCNHWSDKKLPRTGGCTKETRACVGYIHVTFSSDPTRKCSLPMTEVRLENKRHAWCMHSWYRDWPTVQPCIGSLFTFIRIHRVPETFLTTSLIAI